jgi:hypothetical protein
LQAPLKYGGNGPIASPSKVVQNSRNMHSAEALAQYSESADFDPTPPPVSSARKALLHWRKIGQNEAKKLSEINWRLSAFSPNAA